MPWKMLRRLKPRGQREVIPRLTWRDEADAPLRLAKKQDGNELDLTETPENSLQQLLGQRLLLWTPSLMPIVERLALASHHDLTVLFNGETGTGKSFLARLIHEHSPRQQHRFLTVSCGSMCNNLLESEFFGHVRGAFTGADRNKVGKFAAVGQGTLLLDEIDTLGLEQQAALLRVIETGEFEPVGSVETQKCIGRLIVTSNLNLEQAVARGKFRADLYFRLNVMSIQLPPLRERVQDIAPLASSMAARFNRKFNKDLLEISPEAMAALELFAWPGNIRELENAVQHAVLISSGAELLLNHLPVALQEHAARARTLVHPGHTGSAPESLHHQRDLVERSAIQRALNNSGHSRGRAADALGISRVTLYKKMKKHGLLNIHRRVADPMSRPTRLPHVTDDEGPC